MSSVGVAILGYGKAGRAQAHWFGRRQDCRVMGIYDPDEEKVSSVVGNVALSPIEDWRTLVTRREVDLVCLCGPESSRLEQAEYSANNKKQLFLEKPLANSWTECCQILEACDRNSVKAFVNLNMRFHPVVEAVDLHIGSIGPVYSARLEYTQFRTNVTWRHQANQLGGVLKSQGVHAIDLLLHWLGEAQTVVGEMLIVHPDREVEDWAAVSVRFKNHAVGEVYAAYTDRKEEAMVGVLQGANGRLEFTLSPYEPAMNAVVRVCGDGSVESIDLREPDYLDPVYPGLMDCSERAVQDVVRSLRVNHKSRISLDSGIAPMQVVFAGYQSQATARKIRIADLLETACKPPVFPRFNDRVRWPRTRYGA